MSLDFLRTWFDRKDGSKSQDSEIIQLQIEPDFKLHGCRFEFKKPASRRRFLLNNGLAPGTTPGFPVPSADTRFSLTTNPNFPMPITMEENSHSLQKYDVELLHRDRRLGMVAFDWPSVIMTLAGDSALGFCAAFILVLFTSSIFVAVATFWRDVNGQSALESLDIQYDAIRCARQYADNQCDTVKIQGTALLCLSWRQCMEADTSLVLRSKVIARLLADLVDDFFGHLSNRTLAVLLVTSFLVLQKVGQLLEARVMRRDPLTPGMLSGHR